MNKVLKIGAMSLVLGTLVFSSTGCACSVNNKKSLQRAELLKDTEIGKSGNDQVDFTATYRYTSSEDSSDNLLYVVSRDVETGEYYYTATVGGVTTNTKVYISNSSVYKEVTEGDVTKDPEKTNYGGTTAQYEDSDYYNYTAGFYKKYKEAPYHSVIDYGNSDEQKEQTKAERLKVPEIFAADVGNFTCKVTKKLFGSEYTYNIKYRINISTIRTLEIVVNKDNKITYIKSVDSVAKPKAKNEFIEYTSELTISYSNVK